MDASNARKKFWRTQIKHRVVEAFGNQCQCCHQSYPDCCYDAHHLNPDEKDFNISAGNMNGAKSWNKIRDEVTKCALVCSNCHRLIHNHIIESPIHSNFNFDYYDWDLTQFKQIDAETLSPLDNGERLICPQCGGQKSPQADLCSNCSSSHALRFDVTREELKDLIYKLPFTKIGEQFGVSDNAIRKRCLKFGLPSKKTEIKKFSIEEWEKI
jgi:ribosomal protein L40E